MKVNQPRDARVIQIVKVSVGIKSLRVLFELSKCTRLLYKSLNAVKVLFQEPLLFIGERLWNARMVFNHKSDRPITRA